jgi:hypothetical protein
MEVVSSEYMYYFLTFLFGLLGVLGAVRSAERLITGAGMLPAQLLIAVVFLFLAGLCLRKARAAREKN